MELQRKLEILADAAKYDASCASSGARRAGTSQGIGHTTGNGICHSYTPDGRCVSLLKILLTNVCIYDCLYCVNRVSSDIPRARFTVDEVVTMTLDFYRRNYIEAVRHPEAFPVDVNVAPKEMLLRIPGIGQRSVDRMIRARRLHRLTLRDLQTLRVRLSLARPFIVTADWQPGSRHRDQPAVAQFVQPLLWSA